MTITSKGTALITGASSGIGAVYADRLSAQGYDLILVARSAEKLRSLATALRQRSGRSVETIEADLIRSSDLARVDAVLRSDPNITMLVNNAGVGATAPLLGSDVDAMEKLIDLNVTALMRLAYAAAPGFAARDAGTIVNIASNVAVAPEVLNGVYGGSKAFVLAFSQSLHHELAGRGVRVQAVLPGATATDFQGIAGTPIEHLPSEIVMRAEDMVDAALAGLYQGELAPSPRSRTSPTGSVRSRPPRAAAPPVARKARRALWRGEAAGGLKCQVADPHGPEWLHGSAALKRRRAVTTGSPREKC